MKVSAPVALTLYVLLFLSVCFLSSFGLVLAGDPRWLTAIQIAGFFVWGWYHRRIWAAIRRRFVKP